MNPIRVHYTAVDACLSSRKGRRHPGFLRTSFSAHSQAVIFWALRGPSAKVSIAGTDPRSEPVVAGTDCPPRALTDYLDRA